MNASPYLVLHRRQPKKRARRTVSCLFFFCVGCVREGQSFQPYFFINKFQCLVQIVQKGATPSQPPFMVGDNARAAQIKGEFQQYFARPKSEHNLYVHTNKYDTQQNCYYYILATKRVHNIKYSASDLRAFNRVATNKVPI